MEADLCDGGAYLLLWGLVMFLSSSLIYIGIVTAFIGDLAALMGCCLGLKDVVTAITFVALGYVVTRCVCLESSNYKRR